MVSRESLPRILCVDDEPHVLDGLARALRRGYQVTTAVGGAAGISTVQREGPFAVVVSDLRMPGIDGVAFLSAVRKISPDTVRVLLTGQADMAAAIDAVNEGEIFRFLTKPCAPERLNQALASAAEQHRLITAERVLLEQTLHGSIKAMTDILALVNPAGFGRAARAKELASSLVGQLEIDKGWQIEIAAMLSQVGSVTLPEETLQKLYRGEPLTPAEQLASDRLPRIASDIIANVPRMEEVRAILMHQNLRYDGSGSYAGAPRGEALPLGSRLLKLALDFDTLETRGMSSALAIDTLRGRAGWYDPKLLQALAELRGASAQQDVLEIELGAVRIGMVFAEDIKTATGVLLIARGQEVTERLVERVRNFSHLHAARQRVRVIIPANAATSELRATA